jgi:centromeric protein E
MQLYNEEVNDLLSPGSTKLPVHESKEAGIYVAGLREDIVTSPEQVLSLLEEGESNRHTGATKMNERSSRSHTVFRMVGAGDTASGTDYTPSPLQVLRQLVLRSFRCLPASCLLDA